MIEAAAWIVFGLTYLAVATGRLPGFRIDRAGAALVGAAAMTGLGVISLPEAYRAIDWNTIVLLLGTMIVAAHLTAGGVFIRLRQWAAIRIPNPLLLLAFLLVVSAIAAAFLVNDTVCLVLAPVVATLAARLGRNPVPYLLGVALGTNIGSVATLTGNPQNMIIGSASGISYGDFARVLTPVAAVGLLIAFAVIGLCYRSEFRTAAVAGPISARERSPPRLNRFTLAVTLAMVFGFFLIDPVAKPALLAASVLLLFGGLRPRRIYAAIDWSLLLMFCGLFVVSAAIEKVALTPGMLAHIDALPLGNIPLLTLIAAILSNLVSNVPAVLILKPFVVHLAHPRIAWLCLAMASTLAGNLTIVGSVATMIVVEKARAAGVAIGFGDYLRIGIPVTVLTLAAGVILLVCET